MAWNRTLVAGFLCSLLGCATADVISVIPSAQTTSSIITIVTVSGEQPTLIANPDAYAGTTTSSVAVSMSTTVRAIQETLGLPVLATNGISLYGAGASVGLFTTVADQVVFGGAIAMNEPIVAFHGSSETWAVAGFTEPLFARAAALSQGILDGAILGGLGSGSSLDLSWNLERLALEVEPAGGLALLSQRVQFFQVSKEELEKSLGEVSLLIWLEDGKASLRVFDGSNLIVFQGQVGNQLTLGLDTLIKASIALPTTEDSIALRIVDTRTEVSMAAAPRASIPVLTGVGSSFAFERNDTPRMRWNPDTGILSFDSLPINWRGGVISDKEDDALFLGGKIEIGDFHYIGESGGRRYFTGSKITLTDSQGRPMFSASLPALVLENSLFQVHGFNFFAPILNVLDVKTSNSRWIDGFMDLLTLDAPYLPEIFLGVDDLALKDQSWQTEFSAPINGLLSFAGLIHPPLDLEGFRRPISLPETFALIVLGLILMIFFSVRPKIR
ncbi:MAG: hypothetical protein MZV65_35400 [Chromatiales bacterium]|nr:hypothetical protein [Chromatiales bacterium]